MGRGDKRTKRGKIWRSSYGKTRPHKVKKVQTNKAKQEQE